jgi:D-glycero-D-manno-heptose 1,7-bisphosphate phosphatase
VPNDQAHPQIFQLRTVFLDRDGVLNEKQPEGNWVTSTEGLRILPGVPDSVARLNKAGLLVLVVSNQRGVAQGKLTIADVEGTHAALQRALMSSGARIDAFFICPHEKGKCDCRKPLTGLYEQAKRQYPAIEPETSVMIGDSLVDIQFGRKVGMRTIFLVGGAEQRLEGAQQAVELADFTFSSLSDAVEFLLKSAKTPSA